MTPWSSCLPQPAAGSRLVELELAGVDGDGDWGLVESRVERSLVALRDVLVAGAGGGGLAGLLAGAGGVRVVRLSAQAVGLDPGEGAVHEAAEQPAHLVLGEQVWDPAGGEHVVEEDDVEGVTEGVTISPSVTPSTSSGRLCLRRVDLEPRWTAVVCLITPSALS